MGIYQKERLLALSFRHGWIQKLKDCHQDPVSLHLSTLLSSVLAFTHRQALQAWWPLRTSLCSAQLPQLLSHNCSSQNPKPDSHGLELGHVPILGPIIVAKGDEITDWLGLGHMLTPRFWGQVSLTQQHELKLGKGHFPKEERGCCN